MYTLISILIILFSVLFGIYYLFVESDPALGVHFLLITLYFFLSYYERKQIPFSKPIYYLLFFLLIADGFYFLFFSPTKYLLSGIIGFFFAFSTWMQLKRIN